MSYVAVSLVTFVGLVAVLAFGAHALTCERGGLRAFGVCLLIAAILLIVSSGFAMYSLEQMPNV